VSVEAFKREVVELAAGGNLTIPDILALASDRNPGWRVSDRLALAERAVWELLHWGQVRIVRGQDQVDSQEWETVLLSAQTWTATAPAALRVEPVAEQESRDRFA
jgi:hypothetical protein